MAGAARISLMLMSSGLSLGRDEVELEAEDDVGDFSV